MLDKGSNLLGRAIEKPEAGQLTKYSGTSRIISKKNRSLGNCPDHLKSTPAACRIDDRRKHQTKDW